jgi:hypothetical protein
MKINNRRSAPIAFVYFEPAVSRQWSVVSFGGGARAITQFAPQHQRSALRSLDGRKVEITIQLDRRRDK